MEIEDIQKRVLEFERKWADVKNVNFDEQLTLIHLMEELGELAQQVFYRKAKPEKFNEERVKEEICGVLLTCLCMADRLKMNIPEELNKKLKELKERYLYKNNHNNI